MKTQISILSLLIILLFGCSKEESINEIEELNTQLETQENIDAIGGQDSEKISISKPIKHTNTIGNNFLGDPNGNPFDCSSYIPKRTAFGACPFEVYYNTDILINQGMIDCVRKEYFENNPDLRLYVGPLGGLPLLNGERWIFLNDNSCGPTNGRTPVNGSNEDADTDGRVCIRRPCE